SICGSRRTHELRSQPERGVASAWALHRPRAQGRKARGLAGGAGQQVRACDQSPDCPDARPHGTADAARDRRRGDRVRRRAFITLVAGPAAACPLAAPAQQAGKVPTIVFLGQSTRSAGSEWIAAFVQRLRELGWSEGRTIAIEYRWGEGREERFAEVAAEFVRLKVDIIVT